MRGFDLKPEEPDQPQLVEKEMAKAIVEDEESLDRRRRVLLASVIEQLRKGKKISVTKEMRELEIDGKVWGYIIQYSRQNQMMKLLGGKDELTYPTEKELLDRGL